MIDLAEDKAGRAPVCKSHVSFEAVLFFAPASAARVPPLIKDTDLTFFRSALGTVLPPDHQHTSSAFMLVTAIQIGFEREDGWCHRHHSGGD